MTGTRALSSDAILILVATRWEATPLVRRLRLKAVSPSRFEGHIGNHFVVLLRTGVGPRPAAQALSSLEDRKFSLAISTGYAGALQANLRAGDIIADMPETDRKLAAAGPDMTVHFGKITHSDREVCRPQEKLALGREIGALAVDMETAALRHWARPLKIPVWAVRVISDGTDECLPGEFPSGGNLMALCAYTLRHPGAIPTLATMGWRHCRVMPRYSLFLFKILSSWEAP